jgi:small subunit ribosomal protein S20
MANTSSARKAHRASLKKHVFNVRSKRSMKDAVKDVSKLIEGKKGQDAEKMLPVVHQALDKAVKRGVIKSNTAARTKSRITARIRAIA